MVGKLLRRAGVPLLAAFALLGAPGTAAAAMTWVVDDDGVECSNRHFATIQAAVNAAGPGDTIEVCAGVYPELVSPGPLTINKQLTLEGAQAGVDARARSGPESIIMDPQGTSVGASGVVIDGFTVQDSLVAAFTGQGIFLNPGISGTEIVNNIIQNNILGIGLANAGPAQAVIEHNLIRTNNRPGGASGSGIYTDQFSGGAVVRNVVIRENAFVGHAGGGAAINISNTAFGAGGVFDLDVLSNRFDANSRAFLLFNTHDSVFDGNTVTGSTFAGSADVRLLDDNTNLLFTLNTFRGGAGHAVRSSLFFGTPSSNVQFHQNNFEVYALTGMTVDPASHVGTVDAECNWWNSASGPFDPIGNPGGTGEEVVGDADYRPWLIAPAPGGPCLGGEPPTPGKVTGGGQIDGDPLFSPFGDLLSLPAFVPTLLGGNSNSSFGFVARCCAPAGNLSYHDHGMDVRIKAVSIDGLFITSPGESCAATPGSKHATITGMAEVTRATGTATESLIVEVDDCGEPGSSDTFRIETDSYSSGPARPLVGGNVKIHG